jgi:hypothetical protein
MNSGSGMSSGKETLSQNSTRFQNSSFMLLVTPESTNAWAALLALAAGIVLLLESEPCECRIQSFLFARYMKMPKSP